MNIQEIVPVGVESDNLEDENIRPNIKAYPNSSNFTSLMRERAESFLNRCNSLSIFQDKID